MTTSQRARPGVWRAFLHLSIFALASSLAAPLALAQEGAAEPPKQELPDAKRIIDLMITADGGREAMVKLRTRTIHGDLEIAGMGMKAKFTSWNAGSGKYRETMAMEGFGDFEQGMLGEVAWANDPMQGGRLLEGIEKDLQRRSSHFHPLLHLEEDYSAMVCVGLKEIHGQMCYELTLTPRTGQPESWFIRESDLLVVRTEMTYEAPQVGKLKVAMDYFDYREVSGLRLPHRMELVQGPQKMSLSIQEYVHNDEIPDEKFALPPAVQALVDKQSKPTGVIEKEPEEGAKPPAEKPEEGAKPPAEKPEEGAKPPVGGTGG